MQDFMNRNDEIKYQGYIDNVKSLNNIRFLTLNMKGLDLWNNERIEMFKMSVEKNDIDIMLLNEVNIKWNPLNVDKIEKNLRSLGQETAVYAADSTAWISSKNNYLSGGVLSIFCRKMRSLILEEKIE